MRAASRFVAISASVLLPLSLALAPAGATRSSSFVPISGSGSSFAAIAMNLWALDVRPRGLVVNFNPDGSDAGRADYIVNQDDYAVSDEPFRTSLDKLVRNGSSETAKSSWLAM